MKLSILVVYVLFCAVCFGQHNNELFSNGGLIHIQPGAEVHVMGDVHMVGTSSVLENDGLLKTQGNSYSNTSFQQTGTGTYRVENSNVNVGERQFISGSYAVRGGQGQIGVDDGSFYDLELANDQGIVFLVGSGNVADVRNAVNFNAGSVMNRIITHDIGLTGAYTPPANGSGYSSVFGLMNSASGQGSLINNTISTNGNLSGVDNGYIQGKFRRAIDPAGGSYGFVVGVEPGGTTAQKGVQYVRIDIDANDYNVITSYFESASSNASSLTIECSGESLNYWGGVDHGEWMFSDISGAGSGIYEMLIWPQDHNYPGYSVWAITKDNGLSGTANDCGPTTVGLSRTGFNGFGSPSEFNVAAPINLLPIELIDISAQAKSDHIDLIWNVASEYNLSHYEIERSENALDFHFIASASAMGGQNDYYSYLNQDFDIRYNQDYYYRVKSIDFDGDYEYSPIVTATLVESNAPFDENAVTLYPNPSSSNFVMSINSSNDREIGLRMYDVFGKLVKGKQIMAYKGNTSLNIQSENWANGMYMIELRDLISGEVVIKRFIKN